MLRQREEVKEKGRRMRMGQLKKGQGKELKKKKDQLAKRKENQKEIKMEAKLESKKIKKRLWI